MSVSSITSATVEIRRSRLLGLVAGVAAVAAAITWALTAYAVGDTEQQSLRTGAPAVAAPVRPSSPARSAREASPLKAMAAVCGVVMCGPNERLAQALRIRTRASAFASLSAREREYLKAMTAVCSVVMCQPNDLLAARLGLRTHR